jgi:hypothetical protein
MPLATAPAALDLMAEREEMAAMEALAVAAVAAPAAMAGRRPQ